MLKPKIIVAMYSTVKGTGWKSSQFIFLKSSYLYNKYDLSFFGMRRRKEIQEENETLSYLPMLASSLHQRLSSIFRLKKYKGYMLGEKIFGLVFSKKISQTDASVLICKPRPFNIIEKFNGKIILEYGESHPIYMKEKIEADYIKFKIAEKNKYIYTDKNAINESIKAINKAHTVILLSDESKKTFKKYYDNLDKFKVIRFPININSDLINNIKEKTIFENSKTTFIITAFHSFVKGTHLLLEAWKKAKIENAELLIAGPLNSDMAQYISENGPFEKVKFLGQVNIKNLYNTINKGVGISLSHAEGYPRATQEYLEYGFPVIISQICSLDRIKNNNEGIIVDISNEDMIIDSLRKMLNFDYYMYLRKNTIITVEKLALENNIDIYVNKLDNLIEESLNENKYP